MQHAFFVDTAAVSPHMWYTVKHETSLVRDNVMPQFEIEYEEDWKTCTATISDYDVKFFNERGIIPVVIRFKKGGRCRDVNDGHLLLLMRTGENQGMIYDPKGFNSFDSVWVDTKHDEIVASVHNGLLSAFGSNFNFRFASTRTGQGLQALQHKKDVILCGVTTEEALDFKMVQAFIKEDIKRGYCLAWTMFEVIDHFWAGKGACREFILFFSFFEEKAVKTLKEKASATWLASFTQEQFELILLPLFTRLLADYLIAIAIELAQHKHHHAGLFDAEVPSVVTDWKQQWAACAGHPERIFELIMTAGTYKECETVSDVITMLKSRGYYANIEYLKYQLLLFGKQDGEVPQKKDRYIMRMNVNDGQAGWSELRR